VRLLLLLLLLFVSVLLARFFGITPDVDEFPSLITYILSLHFNDHFPDGSGLAGTRTSPSWILLELRMTEVVVTKIGAINVNVNRIFI